MLDHKLYLLVFILTVSSCSMCENAPSNDFQNSVERLELNESFRIGDEARGDTLLFGQITGIALNSINQFFVWDDASKAIHVFSEKGDLIRTFGREGEGPGEFSSIVGLHVGLRVRFLSGISGIIIFPFLNHRCIILPTKYLSVTLMMMALALPQI